MRTRAERRRNNINKALRKKKIAKEVYGSPSASWEYYDSLHQYSKNKIHCSCPICSMKTKNKGKRKSINKNFNPPLYMRKRLDEMDYEIEEME